MARRVRPSERMHLEERVAEPHMPPVLREFLELAVERRDAWIRVRGGGMRFVSRWFPWL